MGASAVDGFALGVVPALLLLRLVPHVVEGAGAWGVALVCIGFGALWLADRGHDHAHPADDARTAMTLGARLVVPALVLHALSDGAALAMATVGGHSHAHGADHDLGGSLAGAVLLHRLPEGLFLTMTFLPRVGWRGTWASPRRRGRGHRRGRRARAGAVAGGARRLL
jgi:zinc transporter ZupT